MRILIAAAFAAVALTGCATAPLAYRNPYDIPADNSLGMIIMAVDDAPPSVDPRQTGFGLTVKWFDPVNKKPHYEKGFDARYQGLSLSNFVNDENGHRYLIGSIGQGEVVITSYNFRAWSACYDTSTYHFFVKGGSYNFIGRFNDQPAYQALDAAVTAGKLPATVPADSPAATVTGQTLAGLTPADQLAAEKPHVAEVVGRRVGHAVDIETPALTRTNFNAVPGKCTDYSDRKDRPDRSMPAAPETSPGAPAADSAAKPAAATTWIPRAVP